MKRIALALGAASLPGLALAVDINLTEQLAEGGAAVLVTLGLSVLFLAVTIERFIHLRARAVVPDGLVARIEPLWTAHRFDEIERLLSEDRSALARVLAFLVAHRRQPYAVVTSAAGDIASMELRKHQHKAYALAIVATVAPIVGLLGTVLGMIDIFSSFTGAGMTANASVLAGGISKALITTAAGLMVGIPSVFFHRFLQRRIDELVVGMEQEAIKLVEVVQGDRDVDLAEGKK